MTPDEIKEVVEREFPGVVSETRHRPDGWSFYWRSVRKGAKSTRIARAVQWTPQAPTKFKLAVTSRREGAPFEIEVHTPEEVRRRFADELQLWQTTERTGD